jgi:U3 small nucleolar RNA-associated protein 12
MSMTNNGMHIVTAAHDRSIRLWERTEEPLILDEEKEQVIVDRLEITIAEDISD